MTEDLRLTAAPGTDATGATGTTDTAGSGCGCGGSGCGDSIAATGTPGAAEAVTATYGVLGMTCAHCTAAVTEELSALDVVTSVDVRLVPGGTSAVRVVSTTALDRSAVAGAVDEAGYELADAV